MEKSKVILLPCETYGEENIYSLMKKGLELLGGLPRLIGKEEKILLKPNLLKKAEVEKAVITHPVVVGAFARILREEGYKNIVLADSCGNGTTNKVIKGTGMDDYLEKYQIPAIDYTEGVQVTYPEGIQAKEFILPKELLEADCVISLSKMKTHALERITGAVKNSYGFVYGRNKAIGHTKYPSADSFARMLIDLNRYVKPRLYIMDGIMAMEGNGPGSGDPAPMKVMLMSKDPVALDSVFARLVNLKPQLVPTNYHGEKMEFGSLAERENRASYSGRRDLTGGSGKNLRKFLLSCGSASGKKGNMGKNGESSESVPEKAVYRSAEMYRLRCLREQLPCSGKSREF